jgi:hypothetical protein
MNEEFFHWLGNASLSDSNLKCQFHRKKLVPVVPNVPDVAIVEDVPTVIIRLELWRKTSGIVPDCPHHIVPRGGSDAVLFRGR